MKRDLGLVRELLLKLEPLSQPHAWQIIEANDPRIQVESNTPDEIEYNLQLLVEQGFIEEPRSGPMQGIIFRRLTWAGHDYLDAVRDPKIWRKTKEASDKVGSWTFELVKELAKGIAKGELQKLGFGLG
jgi:DNA-binding PadR family transcriptional regulator